MTSTAIIVTVIVVYAMIFPILTIAAERSNGTDWGTTLMWALISLAGNIPGFAIWYYDFSKRRKG